MKNQKTATKVNPIEALRLQTIECIKLNISTNDVNAAEVATRILQMLRGL